MEYYEELPDSEFITELLSDSKLKRITYAMFKNKLLKDKVRQAIASMMREERQKRGIAV